MSLRDWVRETRADIVRNGPIDGGRQSARKFHYGAMRRLDGVVSTTGLDGGRNVLDEPWDLLVVLDGCRHDLMTETAGAYDYVESVEPFTSLAGGSLSWMRRTFASTRDVSDVAYVTANPFSDTALDPARFAAFDEVWRTAWDDTLGTVRAQAVTKHAVDGLRHADADRAIVHYMQPHHPFVPAPVAAGINRDDPSDHDTTVWERLRHGTISRERAWRGYRDNLEYVMNEVATLLENVDAPQTVITADHGNALGEWGIYGHGDYPISALRRVPWCTATATDERTLTPEVDRSATGGPSVADRLRDLGYR